MADLLHVFLFEHVAVRGALVQLDQSWRTIRSLRTYPAPVERLLGESIVAAALLASTIKTTSGTLLLQMQGDGPLTLLVAECSNDFGLRCTARWSDGIEAAPLSQLVGQGRCAITLGNADGSPRYQGIVPLEAATLAAALEGYMARSEQLDTRIELCADANTAAGMLLQRIPDRPDADEDGWNRVIHLGATVTAMELSTLPAPALLRRLFPEDDVRLFSGRTLRFACKCTPERVRTMLTSLGQAEVASIIAERGEVEVVCDYCNQRYAFGASECDRLFPGNTARD